LGIDLRKEAKLIFDSPDVEFCGYSIPHPSEELMNIRIQTYGELFTSQKFCRVA